MNQQHLKQEFAQLAAENQGIIHKVCSMYCDRESDQEDLFQDILVQWWRAYPSFKGDSKFTTWAYRVAINTAISNFRKQKRRPTYQSLSADEMQIPDIPTYSPEQEERKYLLRKAILQLTKVEKAIIMLYLEDQSYEEIGAIVGITKNHVGVKISRIKAKLKTLVS